MPFSNSIGDWQELTISGAITENWKIYQDSCTSASLFELKFLTDWDAWNSNQGWHSYGLIRSVYSDLSNNVWYGKAQKIYPSELPTFLEFPIYPSLVGKTILRNISVRRVWQKYPIPETPNGNIQWNRIDPNTLDWSLNIAYLLN